MSDAAYEISQNLHRNLFSISKGTSIDFSNSLQNTRRKNKFLYEFSISDAMNVFLTLSGTHPLNLEFRHKNP